MRLVAGIDTGGTFTDLVVLDPRSRQLRIGKTPSTPRAPAEAVYEAFDVVGVPLGDVSAIVLGTTIATNALIQRRGARVLYVTTAGFEDIPLIGRIDKEDPYDLGWRKPTPVVKRFDCFGVHERVAFDGAVLEPLVQSEVDRVVEEVERRLEGAEGPFAIAVNLLFAYANPEHERVLGAALAARLPGVPVSLSHQVSPIWREYERGSTTLFDAYLKPVVQRLTSTLDEGLATRGFAGRLSIMKSNGGQMLSSVTSEAPIETVLSGLSGGIVAGRLFGQLAGQASVITFDMGGTSADVGLIREGEISYVQEFEFEYGMPIVTPAIDLVTVGAGGGSIAWIDEGGLLRVGPKSAGADPGPVCYGLGGTEVTVTDANLVLGRLDPEYFLGGRIALDEELAHRRVAELGERLGLSASAVAQAIVQIAVENMASAMRRVAVDRGADPRDYELVAFGGAGPLHAAPVAAALGMKGVIVPPHPGLGSAFGTLAADRRIDKRWTQRCFSDRLDVDAVDERFENMASDALVSLRREGYEGEPLVLRAISMRYAGQNYERDVPVPSGRFTSDSLEQVVSSFHQLHHDVYGYSLPGEQIELIHFNVTALGPTEAPALPPSTPGPTPTPVGSRLVDFPGAAETPTSVYRREQLPAGFSVTGPVIVEEEDSTTLVLPGQELTVEATGLMRIRCDVTVAADGSEIDSITMGIIGDQLVSITQEMGSHMMRSAYSPIFSESRDFSCALFDRAGRMLAQGPFCPAQLGAISETVRCVLAELGFDALAPGDVVVHNDPYRGGCHLPEHMLLGPIYVGEALVGYAATIGHLAEIGAATVGSFVSDATEVYQEGLRLPPIKLFEAGEPVKDVWRILLANHRTPRNTWGDLHAMAGSLRVAEQRVRRLAEKHGVERFVAFGDQLLAHGERMMRRVLTSIPDGEYSFEDFMEDDGIGTERSTIRVKVVIRGDRAIVDYTGSDPQARGPVNATFGVTTSATYNAFLQLSGVSIPRNAGAYRQLVTIAPPGTIVNVAFPGPSVGGNTETQPKLVGMILGALASVMPDRVMAAEGVTSCNFLFGGIDPRDGEQYAHYHFEASGWGGRAAADGNDAQNHIHGNCRNTPTEVFETRFPLLVCSYGLIEDSGGAGTHRGGLAIRRVLRVLAPITASAMMDRVKVGAWGLFGGQMGRPAAILVRRAGDDTFRTFTEAFGTISPSKFSDIALEVGDEVMIESAGGGGFGPPVERAADLLQRDLDLGFVTPEAALASYGVELHARSDRPADG